MLLLSFILLALIFTGLGTDMGTGAKRWLDFGAFTFQPTEFCKLSFVLFPAAFMSSRRLRIENFWSSSFIPLLLAGIAFLFIVSQPDLGSALILLAGAVVIILLAGMPFKQVVILALVSLPALVAITIKEPYRLKRLFSFLDPGPTRPKQVIISFNLSTLSGRDIFSGWAWGGAGRSSTTCPFHT